MRLVYFSCCTYIRWGREPSARFTSEFYVSIVMIMAIDHAVEGDIWSCCWSWYLITLMVGILDKKPSPDKPEVVAEETVVHAGVGHQAILVCQVVLMFLMILLLIFLIFVLDTKWFLSALFLCSYDDLFILMLPFTLSNNDPYHYENKKISEKGPIWSYSLKVHASPEAEVTWYRGTLLMESDNRY